MTKKLDEILKKTFCLIFNNVRSIINRIKTNCKKIEILRDIKGLPKDELLKNLNISVKTVKEIDLSSLSLTELKLIAKVKRIKNYEEMSNDELLSAFKNKCLLKVSKK